MSTVFRIDRVELDTGEGPVQYEFPGALTVLAGPVGVGKSTLLELIKHALGGKAVLAPVAEEHVKSVAIHLFINGHRTRVQRAISGSTATAQVWNLATNERLPDLPVESQAEESRTLGDLLLAQIGLPTDARAAARTGRSTRRGDRVTFADAWSFLYVTQANMNRDIANSLEAYRQPKRKAVFELLFGLTDEELLALRSRAAEQLAEVASTRLEADTVERFLRDAQLPSRADAEAAAREARARLQDAEEQLAVLQQESEPVDRKTQAYRDLLSAADARLADARHKHSLASTRLHEHREELAALRHDIRRLERLRDAVGRLAPIEFSVCPRCMQDITERQVNEHSCRLCLQPEPAPRISTKEAPAELVQLQDQVAEAEQLIQLDEWELSSAERRIHSLELEVERLSADIDRRTRQQLTPRLQVYADTAAERADSAARLEAVERTLQQWDRFEDLARAHQAAVAEQVALKADIARREDELRQRSQYMINEMSEIFDQTVRLIGVPVVERAVINPTTYLPELNGRPFQRLTPAGGVRTAVQVAYWLTLLSVALSEPDTLYPAFTLIDSPRTSIGNDQALERNLYARLRTLADADGGRRRIQVIVADNALPPEYRRDHLELTFDYDHPVVSTIGHPGEAHVQPIVSSATPDELTPA